MIGKCSIPGRDRAGLERLLRYCARPPFALERLEANGYGAPGGERIVYRLPHPAPDGTTALSLTPLEFLERLALLIHPPRIHRHRYHGVLAPNAKLRDQVIALGHEQGRVEESRPRDSSAAPRAAVRPRAGLPSSRVSTIADSAPSGPPIPIEVGHLFQSKWAGDSGDVGLSFRQMWATPGGARRRRWIT